MHSALNSEDRLALLAVPEWGKLLRHFELGEGFALVVLLVPDTAVSRTCQAELDLWLLARQRPRLALVPVESPESLEQLPEQLLSVVPPSGPVWVSAVGPRDVYEPAWQRCAVKLNRTRDAIVSRYSTTLILVGPPWMREILRDNAPDFWSIRAFVADISLRRTLPATPENNNPVAQTNFEDSPDPDFALAQAAPLRNRPELHRELSRLLDRAGRGLMQRGRSKEAEEVLREALDIRERLVRQEPERADYLRDLSVSYERLGDLMSGLGAGEEARQFFQKALDIRERLVRQEPERADYLRDLSVSYNKMGDLMRGLGAGEEARQFFQKALDIAERLVRQEPERADYLSDLVVSLHRIGSADALRRAITILRSMESEHKLTHAQADWIPALEQALASAGQD